MKRFYISLKYDGTQHPVSGCHNSVDANNFLEALKKVIDYHGISHEIITEVRCELGQPEYPLIGENKLTNVDFFDKTYS